MIAELNVRRCAEEHAEKHDWNQTRAAAYLDITRSALLYRMQKFGLERPERVTNSPADYRPAAPARSS